MRTVADSAAIDAPRVVSGQLACWFASSSLLIADLTVSSCTELAVCSHAVFASAGCCLHLDRDRQIAIGGGDQTS
jgi:hypothetical protein